MHHIQGHSRDQITLFPESLDEYITDDNPVRFLDAFVNAMDLQNLGSRLRGVENECGLTDRQGGFGMTSEGEADQKAEKNKMSRVGQV